MIILCILLYASFQSTSHGDDGENAKPAYTSKAPTRALFPRGLGDCQELAFFSATVSSHALVGAVPLSGTLSSSAMI